MSGNLKDKLVMRVHPNQLSQGFFPFFGPSNFWVKSFNLNNKKIVFSICILFLISVIGSALNKEIIGNYYKLPTIRARDDLVTWLHPINTSDQKSVPDINGLRLNKPCRGVNAATTKSAALNATQ